MLLQFILLVISLKYHVAVIIPVLKLRLPLLLQRVSGDVTSSSCAAPNPPLEGAARLRVNGRGHASAGGWAWSLL